MPSALRVPSDMLAARKRQGSFDPATRCLNSRVSFGPSTFFSTPYTPGTTLLRYSSIRFFVLLECELSWSSTLARLLPSRISSLPGMVTGAPGFDQGSGCRTPCWTGIRTPLEIPVTRRHAQDTDGLALPEAPPSHLLRRALPHGHERTRRGASVLPLQRCILLAEPRIHPWPVPRS